MKILLCSIPDGSLSKTLVAQIGSKKIKSKENSENDATPRSSDIGGIEDYQRAEMPIGILRIVTWLEKGGYDNCEIYDINNLRPRDEELIKAFRQIKPDVVGLSAPLSHCYPNIKRISKLLRELFPNVWIVLGGNLVSSSNMVLRKTEVDICVVGDGEIAFTKLLDHIKLHPNPKQLDYTGLSQIKGLAFIDENNNFEATGYADQLPENDLEYPDYDKLREGYEKYGGNGDLLFEHFRKIKDYPSVAEDLKHIIPEQKRSKFFEKNKDKRVADINLSRGCVARCTFCQRYTKGFRTYKVKDLEAYILELKEKYNVVVLLINDENSFSNKAQAYQVAKIMKKCGVFWEIEGGARVRNMNYEDVKFFRECGLLRIQYGIEGGSQQMLDIMEKKFTKEDVFERISELASLGIQGDTDGIILGMPGETEKTIRESGEFLAKLSYIKGKTWYMQLPFMRWALPIPGTPLYEYCQQIGAVGSTLDDEEEYLMRMSDQKNNFLNYINVTECNTKELYYWNYVLYFYGKYAFKDLVIKGNKPIKNRLLEIYNKCIKSEFSEFIKNINSLYSKKSSYRKRIPKFFLTILNHLVFHSMSLSVLFLPKVVLFPIIKTYSNLKFYFLVEKKFKMKEGKQKYNLFIKRNNNDAKKFIVTEKRIAQTERQIERSLRDIVEINRKQIRPAITTEEKSQELLIQGQ